MSRVSLPVSSPEASGTRARMPTRRRLASPKNSSAGRWRNMLKMICTLCTFGKSIALRPSSGDLTLTP